MILEKWSSHVQQSRSADTPRCTQMTKSTDQSKPWDSTRELVAGGCVGRNTCRLEEIQYQISKILHISVVSTILILSSCLSLVSDNVQMHLHCLIHEKRHDASHSTVKQARWAAAPGTRATASGRHTQAAEIRS